MRDGSASPTGYLFIDGGVFLCRPLPGIILLHAVTHQSSPGILVATKKRQRPLDRCIEIGGGVISEFEAGPRAALRIPLLNRVIESAGRMHHRNGSVLQAVDLIQPARLVT